MLVTFLTVDFELKNERGSLVQLVHDGWKQINVIESKAGFIRGNHYHKFNSEAFYVVNGSFILTVWKDQVHESYNIKPGMFFSIGPNTFHTFEYIEDTLLISMYSVGVELSDTMKDIWTS